MREILFRGKRIDNGEWVSSGNLIRFNPENGEDLVFIPALNEPCSCVHDEKDNIIAFEKGMFYKVDTKTVGQYTGLKDKNGKRIFEGDIVESIYTKKPYAVCFGEYTYIDGYEDEQSACGWYDTEKCGYATAFGIPDTWAIVIGNIHDNPEFLEVDHADRT